MSCEALVNIWFHSDSKGTQRLVLLTIADEADEKGFCRINFPNVAQKANLSISALHKVVDALLARQYLREIEPDIYQIVFKGSR